MRARLWASRDRCSALWFGEPGARHQLDGTYWMAGGICWPGGDSPSGFAVLLGVDTVTRIATVFEERSFLSIHHVVAPGGVVEFEGISSWWADAWRAYGCRRMFWSQPDEIHQTFMLEALRSSEVDPKPIFVQAPAPDESASAVLRWIEARRLEYAEGGLVHNALIQFQAAAGAYKAEHVPAVWALSVAVSGLERWPYRRMSDE